jgi:hypothetical protein
MAKVISCLDPSKVYEVQNIYSNIAACNSPWEKKGNICKHQVKALLLKELQDGIIAQKLGTNYGSIWGGVSHLDSTQDTESPIIEPFQARTFLILDFTFICNYLIFMDFIISS